MTKYIPSVLLGMNARTGRHEMSPVVNAQSFPPGYKHGGPIRADFTAVRCALQNGAVRWFGGSDAWIDSSLRMVLSGIDSRDEVRAKWEDAPERVKISESV